MLFSACCGDAVRSPVDFEPPDEDFVKKRMKALEESYNADKIDEAVKCYALECVVTVGIKVSGDVCTCKSPAEFGVFLKDIRTQKGGTNMKFTVTHVTDCDHTGTFSVGNMTGSCKGTWAAVDAGWKIVADQVMLAPQKKAKEMFMAELADTTERYDDMANYLATYCRQPGVLSMDEDRTMSLGLRRMLNRERKSLSVYNAIMAKEREKGNAENVEYVKEMVTKTVADFQKRVYDVIGHLDACASAKVTTAQFILGSTHMKANYIRYIAQVCNGDTRAAAIENATKKYGEAFTMARELPEQGPGGDFTFDIAMDLACLQYSEANDHDAALKTARRALEDYTVKDEGKAKLASRVMSPWKYEMPEWIVEAARDILKEHHEARLNRNADS